jgi:hypothetical protein
MANKPTTRHARSTAKFDTGAANKSAHRSARQPRRRVSREQSVVAPSDPAAVPAAAISQATNEIEAVPTTRGEPAEQADVPSAPGSDGTDAATSGISGADRPPASTKRAKLIAMLERPEGASVAELGQRLGWLPHTVRAAMTGLRHAGREVTRSKDANGQSIYRLAPVEPADR